MYWLWLTAALLWTLLDYRPVAADPGKYPQYAQQQLPKDVTPEFIRLTNLVDDIIERKKVTIVDVRSREEYQESHIKGAISIPLDEFASRAGEIPKDGVAVLY
ncbi:MAG: rhodanese-like domain-containing protein [Candidatus Binatia bacterium]